jgi:hypothetical protein
MVVSISIVAALIESTDTSIYVEDLLHHPHSILSVEVSSISTVDLEVLNFPSWHIDPGKESRVVKSITRV